ncbi:MAG: hypothetical protein HYS86_02355 [Candidatus Chisholmbacteria bacterium]|nr:hypothetical protein [Candidatus Chisholmbacteria bacterium]
MKFEQLDITVYSAVYPDEEADYQAKATRAGAKHFFRKQKTEDLIGWYETLVGKTVVLIDDDPDNLDLHGDFLSSRGATVLPFSNCEDVLKQVGAGALEFDALITDIDLGAERINGLVFLGLLKELLDQQNQ